MADEEDILEKECIQECSLLGFVSLYMFDQVCLIPSHALKYN